MKILTDIITGAGGINESAIVRTVRYLAVAAAIAGLEAVANTVIPSLNLDPTQKAIILGLALPLIAGAEKWLRNRGPAPAAPTRPAPPASPVSTTTTSSSNGPSTSTTPPAP